MGLAAVPLFRVSTGKRTPAELIRPPGALPEARFLAACVKCGECMKVCPTNALQPALGQAGPEGLWTPVLVPKIGYCEYYCSLCTQVCPTGAIRRTLGAPEARGQDRIGLDQKGPVPALLARQALQGLRRAVPDLAEGHRDGRNRR